MRNHENKPEYENLNMWSLRKHKNIIKNFFGLSVLKYTAGISGRADGTYNYEERLNLSWLVFVNAYIGNVDLEVFYWGYNFEW